MSGVAPNQSQDLRSGGLRASGSTSGPRPRLCYARLAWWGLLLLAPLAALGMLHAADVVPAPAPATVGAPAHLSDEGDRVLDGALKPEAERRSRANALYAEAMLLPEGAAATQDRMLALFRQVVALDPAFTDAQVKLANLLLQSGQLDEAHQQLETLAKEHPGSIPVQVELGYTQRLRGQNEDALRICAKALAADCTQSVAMRVILEIAAEQDDLSGGVVHVEDILKAGGAEVPASAWLALDRLFLEDAHSQTNSLTGEMILRTRLPILQEAAAKSPPDAEALTELAKTYRALGRKLDALQALQRASALHPTDADLISHCAELELDLEQKADAIRDYEKAYALNPAAPGLGEKLAGLYLDNERYADAAQVYESALAESPHDPGLEIDLGIAEKQLHQPDKAQVCFQDVFNALTCPVEAYLELAFFQLEHQELKQAGQTLSAGQNHFPQSARIRFYQAVQHRYEKNYAAALDCLNQVRALASGAEAGVLDQNYYLEDALTLNLAGKKNELEAVLHEGLERYPDDAELMNELAYFWAEQGTRLPEALVLSRRASALEPDNGPIMDTCGWVYFQMGEAKDSLPYLQRAAVLTNNDPVVLQHVGDAYLKLGLRREAIATWLRALAKDPHNGDLTSRIDAAQAQATHANLRSAPRP